MATWTAEDVTTLKTAIASGVLTVRYDGPPARSVTYQNLREMLALLHEMETTIAVEAGESTYRLMATRKGF